MTPMIIDENFGDGKSEKTPFLQKLGRKFFVRGKKVAKPGIQIDINQERPKSYGKVRLASSDPLIHPLIDPNYLSDPEDLEQLIKGVKVVREILSQPEISKYIIGEKIFGQNLILEDKLSKLLKKHLTQVITPVQQ